MTTFMTEKLSEKFALAVAACREAASVGKDGSFVTYRSPGSMEIADNESGTSIEFEFPSSVSNEPLRIQIRSKRGMPSANGRSIMDHFEIKFNQQAGTYELNHVYGPDRITQIATYNTADGSASFHDGIADKRQRRAITVLAILEDRLQSLMTPA